MSTPRWFRWEEGAASSGVVGWLAACMRMSFCIAVCHGTSSVPPSHCAVSVCNPSRVRTTRGPQVLSKDLRTVRTLVEDVVRQLGSAQAGGGGAAAAAGGGVRLGAMHDAAAAMEAIHET